MTQWETSRDAVPEGIIQVTVYDTDSGKRIATVFDSEAVGLIAAAPALLDALEAMNATAIRPTKLFNETDAEFAAAERAYEDALERTTAALALARGEEGPA